MESAFERMKKGWAELLAAHEATVGEAAERCGLTVETVTHLRESRAYAEARQQLVRGQGGACGLPQGRKS